MIRFAFALLIGIGIAAPVALTASDEAVPSKAVVKAAQAGPLAALKGVKAVPMSAGELDAVKGQHVHFLTLSNGKIHLAGDVKTRNNWSSDWGGTDGQPVAPSYKGLCVAHGNGSIFIPTGPPGTPVTLQCPAGS